ncbi:MAG: glycosyltransferase [Planctomycetota bacterium]
MAALEKAPHPGGHVRFGFVGTLASTRAGDLVQAMKSLRDLPIELHIYGSFDPATDEHHKKLEELARGSRVTFHGRFDNSRLAEVYAQIDVLIVPSLWFENSPITIHEAHLTRTPVLASNIGGMAEYVRDGIDGLHFQVGMPRTWRGSCAGLSTNRGCWRS